MNYYFSKKYEKNQMGRDFVVGDIHGNFRELKRLLLQVGFRTSKDRLFSVGDLCDRGPYSHEIFQWIDKPWFFPLRGNHEEILILYELGLVDENALEVYSAQWWRKVPLEHKKHLISRYLGLPLTATIITEKRKIGLVHAEPPHADWDKVEECLKGENREFFVSKCLHSSDAPNHFVTIKNVDKVIVGHMSQKEVCEKGNVIFLDTGSGYGHGKLSLIDLDNLEIHQLF